TEARRTLSSHSAVGVKPNCSRREASGGWSNVHMPSPARSPRGRARARPRTARAENRAKRRSFIDKTPGGPDHTGRGRGRATIPARSRRSEMSPETVLLLLNHFFVVTDPGTYSAMRSSSFPSQEFAPFEQRTTARNDTTYTGIYFY